MDKNENRSATITVRNGWLECPCCGWGRLMKVKPETAVTELPVYCRRCKREITVNIGQSQSLKSQSL